jgi:hypothetical protein
MAKQRASIQGRGKEILLGAPEPVEIDPLEANPDPVEAESDPVEAEAGELESPDAELVVVWPDGDEPIEGAAPSFDVEEETEPYLDDEELERALEEEARDAGPGAGPEEDEGEFLPPGMELAPELGVDLAYSLEALEAEEPAELMDDASVMALEEVTPEPDEEAAMFELPPPEVSDVVNGVLPPKPGETSFDLAEQEAISYDIQEGDEQIEPIELPDRELTQEERAQILAWMGEERLAALDAAIGEAYEEVRLQVADNATIATDCLNRLLKARDIVVRRDAAKIPQAEYYVEFVRARLKRAVDSDTAAKKYQWRILVWGLFWCGAFLAILILLNESWFRDYFISPPSSNALVDMEVFLSTMVWGGIGGVVAVLYSLFKHVGQRDFDVHYNLSYVGKPFLGAIVGATVYMAFALVTRALGILPVSMEGGSQVVATPVAPGVMYLLAWVGGFKENRIFDLVDRGMKRVFSGSDASEPSPPLDPYG